MANTALNRTTQVILTNKSGGNLVYGDVVVLDNTNNNSFTTTTTAGLSTRGLGVILEPNGIANNASGMVAVGGWAPKCNLNTAASAGQFIKTHTVAGQGTPHASPQVEGDFAVALTASATPPICLFGNPNAPIGAGTVTTTGSPANGNLTKFSASLTITNADLTGDVTTSGTVATTLKTAAKTRAITFGFSGGSLLAAQYVDTYVPYACTITAATLMGDVAGNAVIDVLTNSSFSAAPASSIVSGTPPTISGVIGSQDTTLTSWTLPIAANTRIRAKITSTSGLGWATLILTVTV